MYRYAGILVLFIWLNSASAYTLVFETGKTLDCELMNENSSEFIVRDKSGVLVNINKQDIDLEKTAKANGQVNASSKKPAIDEKETTKLKDVQTQKCNPPTQPNPELDKKLLSMIQDEALKEAFTKKDPLSKWEHCIGRLTALHQTNFRPSIASCIDLIEVCGQPNVGEYCCPAECIDEFKHNISNGMDEDKAIDESFVKGDCIKGFAEQIAPAKKSEEEAYLKSAAGKGDIDEIRKLIKKGVNTNAIANDGFTPLTMAVVSGREQSIQELILANANVNQPDGFDETPLMKASAYGRLEILKLLLDGHANVNAKSKDGKTALFFAVEHGEIEVIKTLIASGAEVNARNRWGFTVLYMAGSSPRNKQKEIIAILKNAGAKQ
jgi:hypothetical protein